MALLKNTIFGFGHGATMFGDKPPILIHLHIGWKIGKFWWWFSWSRQRCFHRHFRHGRKLTTETGRTQTACFSTCPKKLLHMYIYIKIYTSFSMYSHTCLLHKSCVGKSSRKPTEFAYSMPWSLFRNTSL